MSIGENLIVLNKKLFDKFSFKREEKVRFQKKGKKNNSESFLDDYFYEIGKNFFNAYIRLYEKKEF